MEAAGHRSSRSIIRRASQNQYSEEQILMNPLTPASTVPSQGVDTKIGRIDLQNGYPTDQSVTRLYDELDFQRAVQAYIWAMPTVAIDALRIANVRDWGVDYNGVGIVDKFTTPAVLALTGNSTTIYAAAFADLGRDGPVVIDSPPGAYGVIDDYWQRPIVEVGPFGPDKGKGGKFLLVPPGYRGDLPKEYLIARSLTNRVMYLARGFVRDGNVKSAVDTLAKISIYPLSQAGNPPKTQIFMAGDKGMDSIAVLSTRNGSPTSSTMSRSMSAIDSFMPC
jgi:hypothetical protein